MSKRGPTAQQRAAIEARGEILVSASAGSGIRQDASADHAHRLAA